MIVFNWRLAFGITIVYHGIWLQEEWWSTWTVDMPEASTSAVKIEHLTLVDILSWARNTPHCLSFSLTFQRWIYIIPFCCWWSRGNTDWSRSTPPNELGFGKKYMIKNVQIFLNSLYEPLRTHDWIPLWVLAENEERGMDILWPNFAFVFVQDNGRVRWWLEA